MPKLCEWFEADGATRRRPARSTASASLARMKDPHSTLLRRRIEDDLKLTTYREAKK